MVLVTTAGENRPNVMTLSWTMVLDFTPRFAFMTGSWNFSYQSIIKTRECVIALPTVELAKKTVQIGSCSGAETDKFKKFVGVQDGKLTAGVDIHTELAKFPVTTTGITNGEYTPTVANLPAGVIIYFGVVKIENGSGTLFLIGSTSTVAGNYTNLQLTIDGTQSNTFTLKLD